MPDTAYAIAPIRGKTVRVTKLDNCGNPVSGAGGMYVTTGFVTVKSTENYDNGNDIKISNANDTVVVYDKGKETLLNLTMSMEFAVSDTGAIPMMTGDTVITDAGPLTAGWVQSALQPLPAYFALEVWTGLANQACAGTVQKYGYWLFPFIENGRVTAGDIANASIPFTIMGNTKQGNAWGKGPYDVISSSSSSVVPAWLPAILPTTAHRVFFVTTVAPPTPSAFAGTQVLTPVSS